MLLEINELYGGYGHGDIVKGVTFHADQGEILCLIGPNGCGKTTLFRLLLGSIPHSSGTIKINGRSTQDMSQKELANQIAYIPQYHSPIFDYSVLDIVIMGRASHFSSFDKPKAIDREAAFDALEKVHAISLANRNYASLSGGQRQLILIARAICQSASIFIMDEPAANLDYANHQVLTDVIFDLAQKRLLYHHVNSQPGIPVLCKQQSPFNERWPGCRIWTPERNHHTRKSGGCLWD